MPDTRRTLLPTFADIAVTGRDARTFLQGQLTNDILGLERHPGMLAAFCNRQGRVLATMRLATGPQAARLLRDDGVDVVLLTHTGAKPGQVVRGPGCKKAPSSTGSATT